MINDFHSKCLKHQNEINKLISEIKKGMHSNNLVKIKEKTEEKLIGYSNTASLLEKAVNESTSLTNDQVYLWRLKANNVKENIEHFRQEIELIVLEQVNKQKSKQSNGLFNNDNDSKITNLANEHESLSKSLKFSRDLDSRQSLMLNELDEQHSLLERIKSKTMSIFGKADFSNTITVWIVKRSKNDVVIFFLLVIVTILIMYFSIYYIKPWVRGE